VKISSDASKTDWQAYLDPSVASIPAGNYSIQQYSAGDGTFGAQALPEGPAHGAQIRLCLEGHRFFDLVRWVKYLPTTQTETLIACSRLSCITYRCLERQPSAPVSSIKLAKVSIGLSLKRKSICTG